MSRRCVSLLTLASLLAACASAAPAPGKRSTPTPAVKPATAVKAKAGPRPLLWRVEGRTGPSYLLGTMHMGVDPHTHLTPAVWTALDNARVLVVETDTSDVAAIRAASGPPGNPLDEQLGKAYWSKLLRVLKLDPSDDAAAQLRKLPAWMVLSALVLRLLPQTPSMDAVIEARATRHGRPIARLEPVGDQIRVLRKYWNAAVLKSTLDRWQQYKRDTVAFLNIYKSGNAAKLARVGLTELRKDLKEDGLDAFLYQRNRRWIPTLVPLLKTGRAFVAVGALHLVGDKSVIALLRERGFKVTRE